MQAAFAEREPVSWRRRRVRPVVALAVGAAFVAAALSPPGRAVLESVREAVGVERAEPALFSLPAPGRLLVESDAGAWVVRPDGSKRLLGDYREASWSPFGRFVVATRENQLAALESDGSVRWTLGRRRVRLPRWGGSKTDTRIAYLSASRLHVVAGDGTTDVDAGGMQAAASVAPTWWKASRHVLAYVDTLGRVTAYDSDAGSVLFRTERSAPSAIEWSARGRLLVVTANGLVLYGQEGQRIWRRRLSGVVAASFSPDGRQIAVLLRQEVLLLDPSRPAETRRIFAGAGPLAGLVWSPDARWVLVGWPSADQWVFLRVAGPRRIQAVSDVTAQFESEAFPRLAGWCC